MKEIVTIVLANIAVVAICFWLMVVNPLVGIFAIIIGVYILDNAFPTGAE